MSISRPCGTSITTPVRSPPASVTLQPRTRCGIRHGAREMRLPSRKISSETGVEPRTSASSTNTASSGARRGPPAASTRSVSVVAGAAWATSHSRRCSSRSISTRTGALLQWWNGSRPLRGGRGQVVRSLPAPAPRRAAERPRPAGAGPGPEGKRRPGSPPRSAPRSARSPARDLRRPHQGRRTWCAGSRRPWTARRFQPTRPPAPGRRRRRGCVSPPPMRRRKTWRRPSGS